MVKSGEHRAYIAPPWKLIWHRSGQVELFHLQNDPLKLLDQATAETTIVKELVEKLRL